MRKVKIPAGTSLNSPPTASGSKVHGQILDCINTNYSIFRNEITMDLELNGKPLSEADYNSLFIDVMEKLPKSKGITKAAFDIVMQSNYIPSYNPIADYFRRNTPPNGETLAGNIEKLSQSLKMAANIDFEQRAGTPARDLVYLFLKKWLVGMVASVYDNHYNVLMPVLIGPKGCGKTEFWRRLFPQDLQGYFTQCKFNNGKDDEALMCENLMILNDELDGLHAKEARTFRNFISANFYSYRPPYGRRNIKRKRLASVCGASNDHGVILDAENNRRIIPIEILAVDRAIYNSIDKTALMIEAYQIFRQGYDHNLTPDEIELLDKFSQGYEVVTVEFELIQDSYEKGMQLMTATEIMGQLQKNTTHQRLKLINVGKALRALGFTPERRKANGKTQQVYGVEPKNVSWYAG